MAKKVEVDLDLVYELSSKGYNVTMICDAIGISRSYAYTNKDVKHTIKKGASEARQSIINDLFARSKADVGATASIFLAKQLKVFDEYFSTSKPKTPKDALTKISNIYEAVARNELSSDKADKLVRYLEAYIKTFEVAIIQDELEALKERFEELNA